jgi:hypothetical protein
MLMRRMFSKFIFACKILSHINLLAALTKIVQLNLGADFSVQKHNKVPENITSKTLETASDHLIPHHTLLHVF